MLGWLAGWNWIIESRSGTRDPGAICRELGSPSGIAFRFFPTRGISGKAHASSGGASGCNRRQRREKRRDETRQDETRQDETRRNAVGCSARLGSLLHHCDTLDIGSCDGPTGRSVHFALKVLKPHGPLNLIEPRVTTSPVAVVLLGSCLGVLALSGTLALWHTPSCYSFMLFYSHSFIISHALDMQRCQESDMR